MNSHALGSLTRIARAGVTLRIPDDAHIVIRLHQLGEAIDQLTEADDRALLTSCIRVHGVTFHRLSIGARHFLLDDVLPCIQENRARIAQAWICSLERSETAFAPFRGQPAAIRAAVQHFERTCPLDPGEIVRVMEALEPPDRPSPKTGPHTANEKPADLGSIIETLSAESGATREYLVWEASEDYVRTLWRRRSERKAREAWIKNGNKGPRPAPDAAFNLLRKRLRDYELEVITERSA